eukprot:2554642-Prymnesium_polylepis.2
MPTSEAGSLAPTWGTTWALCRDCLVGGRRTAQSQSAPISTCIDMFVGRIAVSRSMIRRSGLQTPQRHRCSIVVARVSAPPRTGARWQSPGTASLFPSGCRMA